MQDINGYERFIGLLPGCYSMGVSRPETFAAGANLVLNSAEAPLTALTLYGWSKQDGTPSPDDPVPIESAGSVMTTGAQLIDTSLIPPYGEWDGEHDGVYLKDERTWFLKIPNNNSVARVWNEDFTKARTWGELMPTLSVGDTITFGQNVDLNETNNIAYNSDSGLVVRQGDSVTVTQGFLDALAQFYGVDGADTTCERVEIQINRGTTPLPWEPYTGGQPAANPYEGEISVTVSDGGEQSQSLTVSTPGGLPGIPVTVSRLPEGMTPTYIDDSGQAWVCDEVDFERGVYVRRVWRKTLDGTESWSKYGTPTSGFYGFVLGILPELSYRKSGFCNQFIVSNIAHENTEEIWLGANNNSIYCLGVSFYDASLPDSGLPNWKAHLAAHPLEVMTYLETPIETDLSDEEMAAYKALHTYSLTTTVSNDAGAWMKVGYYGLTTIQKLEKEALLINGGKT